MPYSWAQYNQRKKALKQFANPEKQKQDMAEHCKRDLPALEHGLARRGWLKSRRFEQPCREKICPGDYSICPDKGAERCTLLGEIQEFYEVGLRKFPWLDEPDEIIIVQMATFLTVRDYCI